MRVRHFQRGLVVVALGLAGAGEARADEPARAARPPLSESLEVTEETCLTREKVGERLAPLLANTELPEGLRITLRVDADSKTTFVVSVAGENVGVRSFDIAGLTCENKLKVVSLALAVAIEGIVESRAGKPREVPEPPAPPPPPVPVKPTPAPRPKIASGPGAVWSVGLGEGLFTTSLGSSAAVMASVARDSSRYGFRLSLVQTLGSTVDVEPGSVRYSLSFARLHACANVVRVGTVVGRACALGSAGAFDARGVGFYSRTGGRSVWIDAGAAAEADVRLSRRWTFRGGIAPFAVLRGPTLRVTDERTRQVTASSAVPRVGVLVALEIAFRFDD